MWLLPLPHSVLPRPGPLPVGRRWTYELKWDGFRALARLRKGCASQSSWVEHDAVLPELRRVAAGDKLCIEFLYRPQDLEGGGLLREC